ncbi:MAG: helix-turn-helix domain-containing protein [Isosphaeraceae bacterium]|nr:helix-turn-helix domain-containing protein [Isosphaeraceae bacterium]
MSLKGSADVIADQPDRITSTEVAALAGISLSTAQRLIRSGKLTVVRLPGCRPMVPRDEVKRLIQQSTRPANP